MLSCCQLSILCECMCICVQKAQWHLKQVRRSAKLQNGVLLCNGCHLLEEFLQDDDGEEHLHRRSLLLRTAQCGRTLLQNRTTFGVCSSSPSSCFGCRCHQAEGSRCACAELLGVCSAERSVRTCHVWSVSRPPKITQKSTQSCQ